MNHHAVLIILSVLLAALLSAAYALPEGEPELFPVVVSCSLPTCDPNRLFDQAGSYSFYINECANPTVYAVRIRTRERGEFYMTFDWTVLPGSGIIVDMNETWSMGGYTVANASPHWWSRPVTITLDDYRSLGELTGLTVKATTWQGNAPGICTTTFLPSVVR